MHKVIRGLMFLSVSVQVEEWNKSTWRIFIAQITRYYSPVSHFPWKKWWSCSPTWLYDLARMSRTDLSSTASTFHLERLISEQNHPDGSLWVSSIAISGQYGTAAINQISELHRCPTDFQHISIDFQQIAIDFHQPSEGPQEILQPVRSVLALGWFSLHGGWPAKPLFHGLH